MDSSGQTADPALLTNPGEINGLDTETPDAWRSEVASRLEHYRSRRKPRPPRYPSLGLRFEPDHFDPSTTETPEISVSPRVFPMTSNHALALDPSAAVNKDSEAESFWLAPGAATFSEEVERVSEAVPAGKILEFPRFWTPPVPAADELAEPVMSRPRILEAPELLSPPPALGGITIEPVQEPELEKRPGIDLPLRAAPFERRLRAALIDSLIVAAGCAVFSLIFWQLTAIRPPNLQMAGALAGLAVALWAAYQYSLLVFAGSTPGLRQAGLQLVRFDGSPARRNLRRWRVLASFLSALSLGMGYAWVLLDEDSLCWHDRITRTYLEEIK